MFESHPDPGFVLSSKEIEGSNNIGEIWYEFSIEVGESSEESYGFDGSGRIPGLDSIKFL